jgi:hypothetical protein
MLYPPNHDGKCWLLQGNRVILATVMLPKCFQKPNSRFSATKPAGIIPRENLIIGTHPWLFNKDRVHGLYIPFNHVTSQSF